MNITEELSKLYDEVLSFESDKRVRDKFLMGDPNHLITICFIYLICTIKFTKYMKNHSKKMVDVSTIILFMHILYLVTSYNMLYFLRNGQIYDLVKLQSQLQ